MGKIFKRGLIALAPVAISIAIIIWLFGILDAIFGKPLHLLLGKYYIPGMGLVLGVVVIFLVGLFVNHYVMQQFTKNLNKLFIRIPIFKTLYNSITDVIRYLEPKEKEKRGKMVVVEFESLRFLGILTREEFSEIPEGLGGEDWVCVFIPLSYSWGGYTITVHRSKVKPIDMTVDQGMRFIVTAGMVGKNGSDKIDPLPLDDEPKK